MLDLERKVVIVTDTAQGIGEVTARRFVVDGATDVLVDRNRATLERLL